MSTPSGGPRNVVLAIVIGISASGFLYGTRGADYDLEPTLTSHEARSSDEVPTARSYAEMRGSGAEDADTKVATACVDCHPERVSTASPGARNEHPVGVQVPRGAQTAALADAGGRFDTDAEGRQTIVCRTCHRPHNADVDARLIVTIDDGALCLSCHADHGPSRSQHPVQVPIDAKVRARIEALGGVAQGKLTCLGCHDPHDSTAGSLLRTDGSGAAACRACHDDKARALGSAGHGGQDCIECHGMHRPPEQAGTGPTAGESADQACVDCHASARKGTPQIVLTAGHPMWQPIPDAMAEGGHTGKVGCTDCHVAHGSRAKLLAEGTTARTCTGCHTEKASVSGTDHDASLVSVAGSNATCVSCHAVHGETGRPRPPAGVNPASAMCLSCHDGRTSAKKVGEYTHPKGVLLTSTGLPFRYTGSTPYFGPDGRPTTQKGTGEIACLTCHDPHAWRHGAEDQPGAAEGTEQNSFLRDPSEVQGFCGVCHGVDARPRYRFFHGDQFRRHDVAAGED